VDCFEQRLIDEGNSREIAQLCTQGVHFVREQKVKMLGVWLT